MTDMSRKMLYDIPIQKLNLSVKPMNFCLRLGVTTVGDCVDAVDRLLFPSGGTISVPAGTREVCLEHVLPALLKQGFWTIPLNSRAFAPEIIDELEEILTEKGYMEERTANSNNWYDIPIDKLHLSDRAIHVCKRTGINSIGDCIDYFDYWLPDAAYPAPPGLTPILHNTVLPALIRDGYWQSEKTEYSTDDFAPEIIEELKQKLAEKGYLSAEDNQT